MKHERSIVYLKQVHHRALKDLSEALEQKSYRSKDISEAHRTNLSSLKDISEAHRVSYQIPIHIWLSQKVCTARMILAH